MKTILITIGVLLALGGVLAMVQYVRHHKATVTIEKTSLLPRESIKTEGAAQFTPVMRVESDNLALIEDPSLLGLTAGAFNPRFAPLSASEQNTLNASAQQNPELQNMTAGDLSDNSGLGNASWGTVLVVALLIIIIF
jgi:hypothetical protein